VRDAWTIFTRRSVDEGWRALDASAIESAPDAFGVAEIADGRKTRILIVHGALRDEVERILQDPQTKAHGARFFRYHVTLTPGQAERLKEEILRACAEVGLPMPFVGNFPSEGSTASKNRATSK